VGCCSSSFIKKVKNPIPKRIYCRKVDIMVSMPDSKLIEAPSEEEAPGPAFNPLSWTLTIDGLVRNQKRLKFGEILFLRNEMRIDNYSNFGWDPPQTKWEGFPVRYVLSLTQPTVGARFVVFHSHEFIKVLSIAEVLEYNPILAFKLNDENLPAELGGPLRLVYDDGNDHFGIKWISRIELVEERPPEAD
jgi:DMSO/TMAO reductase YedYZ molybdopterin-dependent catalytic subunit